MRLTPQETNRPLWIVTGASGFIGNRLCTLLVEELQSSNRRDQNCPLVVGIVRNPRAVEYSEYKNLRAGLVSHSLNPDYFHLAFADLTRKNEVEAVVQGRVTMIYHCAAKGGDWGDQESFYQSNVLGVRNMVSAALGLTSLIRFLHVRFILQYLPPHLPRDYEKL
eukprot:TRINITY_DN4815_c0_g1_i17.p1 TRINITY_DN4815_c0_g1~~TRINITY_DN4815_c0_g1_i17.p1  ORF type:complete len:165 (+),score=19.58 TRINITY_DN4815_c0_g1_i17:31-525(+)